jgi:hypothetical protein
LLLNTTELKIDTQKKRDEMRSGGGRVNIGVEFERRKLIKQGKVRENKRKQRN